MIITLANSGKRLLLWGTLGKQFLLWGTLGKQFLLWGTLGNYIIFGVLYGSLGNDFNSKNFKPKIFLLMFDCKGWLHIALHNGIAVVEIMHCQSHKLYVNINLPEKWRTFIKDNHKMGSAKVCRRREVPIIQWNWMKFDSFGKTSSRNPKATI